MHSLGNYVKPKPTYLNKVGSKNTTAEFYCQANAACRKARKWYRAQMDRRCGDVARNAGRGTEILKDYID